MVDVSKLGFDGAKFTPHGLIAGGGLLLMRLKVSDFEIQKRGRWKGRSVLDYLSMLRFKTQASCLEALDLEGSPFRFRRNETVARVV